ncbi:alpha/beta hydrolase [Frigoribacterium sp. ACAM 257]|uniref:esterase/lipase family protein n=1 Tax=Frigoribacterium sp. ACAM 257 TaxID=2508998 RepID=UPI0011B9B59C|nr:alpha/beta hydrolase [Frigoribacterium sp. ACAM 257]TWX37334.1 alpha/beta hydrolase [Frigoribacterium sp. ACAM 257]
MTSAPSRGRGRRRVGLVRFAATVVTDYAFVWRVHLVPRSGRVVPARWRHGDRAPVLLLPGVYETWRHLRVIGERLSDLGHPVVVVPGMRHNRQPIPATAEAAQRILDAHDLRGVVVVAHSKGGLVGKSMMVGTDVERRIDRMVAINSPFSGTRWSRVLPNPALRAFSPRDAALLQLADQLEANERVTSMASRFDAHVTEGSVLPGAVNVTFPVDGHFRPLGNPACVDMVVAAVEGGDLGEVGSDGDALSAGGSAP